MTRPMKNFRKKSTFGRPVCSSEKSSVNMGSLWNGTERAKPTATFSSTNLSWTALNLNRDLYVEMLTTSRLKVLYRVYKHAVPTSQRTLCFHYGMLWEEVIVVYREIMQITCVGKMQEFFMLNLAVHMNILTARPRWGSFSPWHYGEMF